MSTESSTSSLRETLQRRTKVGQLWHPDGKSQVQCLGCGHRCRIKEGREGTCKVRFNENGKLKVPWGYVSGLQCDPIEKKPFYHVLPGSNALSFGMLGCNLHCAYCQNWISSQAIREPNASARPFNISAAQICELALREDAHVITSTYNEPLITFEWAENIFKLGHASGFKTAFVSNGFATAEVLEHLRPHLDFLKVDLKCFRDKSYKKLGAVLSKILESIETAFKLGYFLEIVTLLVPDFNDDPKETEELCSFLAGISPDIPWHISAFHPDFKMQEGRHTSSEMLIQAAEIGKKAGLNFVYAGNLPGRIGSLENTYCPKCSEELIVRRGFRVVQNNMDGSQCPGCHQKIPGYWEKD